MFPPALGVLPNILFLLGVLSLLPFFSFFLDEIHLLGRLSLFILPDVKAFSLFLAQLIVRYNVQGAFFHLFVFSPSLLLNCEL